MPNNYIASVTLYSSTPFPLMWPYNSCGMNMMNKSANRCIKNDSQQHVPAWPMSYPAARIKFAGKYQKNNHIIIRKWKIWGNKKFFNTQWRVRLQKNIIFVFMLRCQSFGISFSFIFLYLKNGIVNFFYKSILMLLLSLWKIFKNISRWWREFLFLI